MKSKNRQEIFKDERTVQIEHKIGNELAFLAIILLLLSIFVKLLYWRLGVVIQLVVVEDSEVVWLQEYS